MEEDIKCNTSTDFSDIKISDPHSLNIAAAITFADKLTAAAELYGGEGAVLHQPDNTELISKAKETEDAYLSLLGEDRFSGLDLKKFMYSRYFVADETSTAVNVIDFQTPTELTLCDEEGNPYKVTVPMLNKYFDTNKKQIQFPLFDDTGYQIVLPLFDHKGKFLLTESITAIDASDVMVRFPLRNIHNEYVKFPVRDLSGNIVTKPTKPSTILTDISAAQIEINNLYEYSKDRHANLFVEYLLEQQANYSIGMFYGQISMNMLNNNKIPDTKYFIVGFFTAGWPATEDIESNHLKYYARYYPDRAEFVRDNYAARGGEYTFTTHDVEFN